MAKRSTSLKIPFMYVIGSNKAYFHVWT